MNAKDCSCYTELLKSELVPALGCTEPIAVALAAAKAGALLGTKAERAEVVCSGNVIKNVMGVTVPNSGGRKGIAIAVALGLEGGDAERDLEVLTTVDDASRARAAALAGSGRIVCTLAPGVDNLYVSVSLTGGGHSSRAVIARHHNAFVRLESDGRVILDAGDGAKKGCGDADELKRSMTVRSILDYAQSVPIDDIRPVLKDQLEKNSAIADYGLAHGSGCAVGQTVAGNCCEGAMRRAISRAAAASDARMSGCTLPVVINSGSGNQGITVSIPVAEYARSVGASEERLYRALAVSNLVSMHQKSYIGSLSAFCGAVSASAGAGAAITYLAGGDYDAVCRTITNTEGATGGLVCDGAKPSCAAKIASSLFSAFTAHEMSMKSRAFAPGEGIVGDDIEGTIRTIGYMGRVGMKETDEVILRLMTDEIEA